MLLTFDGAGRQLKINKAAAAATASRLFQTAWSGRAEMGLAGNDDFAIKVSPDGASWHTAVHVKGSNQRVGTSTDSPPLKLSVEAVGDASIGSPARQAALPA